MIPASLFSVDFAPKAADSDSGPALPALAGDDGDSFTDFISQALSAPQQNSGSPDAQTLPAQYSGTEAEFPSSSGAPGSELNSTDAATSDGNTTQSDSDKNRVSKTSRPKSDGPGLDALTASYLVGMLAQPVAIATNENPKAPVPGNQGSGQEKHESVQALTLNDSRNSSLTSLLGTDNARRQTDTPASTNNKVGLPAKTADVAVSTAKDAVSTTSPTSEPLNQAPEERLLKSQAAANQSVADMINDAASAASTGGTAAAFVSQRMKSTAQKDESAGSTGSAVQKLPRATATVLDSSHAKASPVSVLATGSSGRKSDFASLPATMDLVASVDSGSLRDSAIQEPGQVIDTSTSQVERVTRMIMQEAMTIRQSGATSLAVSLKVDAHTELFVQLTNHDGLIQASLRCEQGSIAGLAGHWGQLQESLARHNVQLLPPDNAAFSKSHSDHSSDLGNSQQYERPSQNERQNSSSLQTASAQSSIQSKAGSTRVSKAKTTDGSGWEYWA